jgi:hypothetical protein
MRRRPRTAVGLRAFHLLRACARWLPEVSGWFSLTISRRFYAATASPRMSRVCDGSTLTPGPMVEANTTERM